MRIGVCPSECDVAVLEEPGEYRYCEIWGQLVKGPGWYIDREWIPAFAEKHPSEAPLTYSGAWE